MKANEVVAAFTGIVVAILVIFVMPIIHFTTMDTVRNVIVTDKERVVTKDQSKYMIFTDGEVFENSDALLSLKFNSSDVYGHIKEGATCTFDVNGFRVPLFSMYRNILTAKCVGGQQIDD